MYRQREAYMAQYNDANENALMGQSAAMARLTADGRQERALFQPYEDTPDPSLQQSIAEHVLAELTRRTWLEETVFYPAFAEQADEEGKRLVSDALQDHAVFEASGGWIRHRHLAYA